MELLLNGYLTKDYDGHPALTEYTVSSKYWAKSIPRDIQNRFGKTLYDDEFLGKDISYIPDCCMSIWYTNEKCTFDEAQETLCNYLDGYMTVEVAYLGYSEWTITGLDLEEFKIGGHDLEKELEDHIGEYCWIRITQGEFHE